MTNSIAEVLNSDVIFVTGSNTTETHPVIGSKIRRAVANGAKLIVAEPRRIDLVKQADVFMQITPGTNVALYNGMMNVILEEGLQDEAFIKERCENYEELAKVIKEYTPERVAEICGINAEDIRVAARLYANAKAASIFYSMGVTQHSTGTSGVMGTSNLALLCGHIGKESSGVNPLRGQNNVQGACDMGCLPGDFTGYQKVANPEAVAKFEKAWGVKLSTEPGHTVTEIIPMAGKGEIKFLYIMGENPMLSDPDQKHVRAGLEALDFLVVQDIFLTETAELADVVLPAASFAEKDGTFTNTERRVQRVRQAIPAPGQAKADWVILQEMMAKLGYEKTYANAAEIMDEIASVTPSYGGINYARLENESLQWPCPTTDHPGTKFLHKDKCARGLGLLKPWEFKPSAELPDSDYPFILSTGRILYHYHTKTMTGKVDGLNNLFPESFVEINPAAAKKLGVAEGGKVRISTRRGAVQATAKVTDKLKENVIFMPFHFADGPANALTNPVLDPIAKIPEFKSCAASVEKI
jgi:formate dehydrogenase major subunit